jgi:hypothetical protein
MGAENDLSKDVKNFNGSVNPEGTIKDLMTPMQKAMEAKGITANMLADKILAELEAKEKKFFAYQGIVVTEREVIAFDVRQKARQDAHKLRGDYTPEKLDVRQHDGPEYTIEDEETLQKVTEALSTKRIEELRNSKKVETEIVAGDET